MISATEARRAYKRAWAAKNPDKVKAQQERYWQKRAAEATAEHTRTDKKETPAKA